MRKLMLGAALAALVGLGGCATTGGAGGGISLIAVVNAARTACSFVPTAATVAGILSANPAIATAADVAQVICAAVTAAAPASARRRGGLTVRKVITVNGRSVIVQGVFE